MKTRGAVLLSAPAKWEIVELELDPPKDHEVLVRWMVCGLCHSDEHHATADIGSRSFPFCGGHEGAGVVEAVGVGVNTLSVGDHVVSSFIAGCGRCKWCANGQQNLCVNGGRIGTGGMLDGTFRMHLGDRDVAQSSMIGAFSELSVLPEISCVKIADHLPFEAAALVGCAVPTGWGSAVKGAEAKPGDTIIVMGVGGVGINAVQGAKSAGAQHIIAVDPVEFKRDTALQLGATHAVSSIEEAAELAKSFTDWQGADAVIIAVGVLQSEDIAAACDAVAKSGIVVVAAVAKSTTVGMPIPLNGFSMFQKRIQGVLYGMLSPSREIPRLLSLYESGNLKLDELITNRYSLDDINVGYADMYAGKNIRGVITYPH